MNQGMQWRVTHVDQRYRRRLLVLECARSADALELSECLFGPARYAAAVRLPAQRGVGAAGAPQGDAR
jgi:hypothetical protein